MHALTAAGLALSIASAAVAQVTITVGGTSAAPQLIFNPANVTASNGTVITFEFTGAPGNHTVTQSSFADPCNPLSGGFDSGYVFIPTGTSSGTPSWNLTITDDSRPLWFYCKQLNPSPHCNAGMVGAINAPSTGNTYQNFLAAAEAHTGNSGQGVGNLVGVGASASAIPGPLTGSITLAGTPSGASATAPAGGSSTASRSSSSSGAPAASQTQNAAVTMKGGVVGAVVGVVMGAVALF